MVGIRARRKAERPGEILEAAFDEFVAKGYAAARLEDVAKRLGVTKGTIYFYFGSKERLFEEAIHTVGSLPLAAFNTNPTPFTGDIAEDVRVFLGDLYAFIDAHPRTGETLRLLVAEAQRFPKAVDAYFAAFMDPVIDRLRSRLAQASAAGEIRQDVPHGAEAIASPPLAYMVMSLLFPDRRGVASEELLRSQVTLLLGGLLPATAPEPASPESFGRWTTWHRAPDPRAGETLRAPIGPGLYELRLASGERLTLGHAHNLAARLAAILSSTNRPKGRLSTLDRQAVTRDVRQLQYRTLSCVSFAEARRAYRTAKSETQRSTSARDGR